MKIKFILFSALLAASIFAQDSTQSFISLKNTGVQEFLDKYPDYDGRGTIVLILDTGIDMGIDGLTKTSTGETKVIDVQDFTGQGDVELFKAEIDEDDDIYYFINDDKEYKVAGADKLDLKAVNDQYMIGLLSETMWMNSGSRVRDVNSNDTTDDQFFVVVFQTKENDETFWVAYIDVNGNGDISDEKPMRDYKVNQDIFKFPNENGLPFFTIGINIFPAEKRISFFYDDGSHGTHCAGIAAGYNIGNAAINGIAPGAYLIGLKLGNNNLAGGATVTESMKNAFLYADKISKERKEPCIINMSFGIGSELEARSDIALFLEELVKENPYLYICTSNGNDGPGISTTGLPAASNAIFSSGAVLAQDIANDLYGSMIDGDIILHFSSRGGEVSKPDVVSPGAATSTVPNFAGYDRFWGTSMASPYSTGVVSLLLSAVNVEFPDVKIPSRLLYKVLRESAVPMEGYKLVDQGGGLININNAFELLKKYIKKGEIDKFETYTVTGFSPNMPDNKAPNMYVRNGSIITGDENFSFLVRRDNFIKKDKFYRIFNLKSDSDWLIPIGKKFNIRNDQPARISYKIDQTKLIEPGLYNGEIIAYRNKTDVTEFEMMATIAIPYEFTRENHYSTKWKDETLAPGKHKRYFLNVPLGASSLKIKLTSDTEAYTNCRFYLHDPDGREALFGIFNGGKEDINYERYYFDPEPGVYELVVLGQYTAKDLSTYDLSVDFNSIQRTDENLVSKENNSIEIINLFDKIEKYKLSGKILGYQKEYNIFLDSVETYDIPFVIKKNEKSKHFKLEISKEDFNKVTDFAFLIYDDKGKAKAASGFSYKSASISIKNSSDEDETNYKLTLIPGYANEAGQICVKITETTIVDSPAEMKVTNKNSTNLTLYPSITEKLNCKFSIPDYEIPEDAKPYGKINFNSRSTDKTVLEIPVHFKF